MIDKKNIAGVVLAGGLSRRMGGEEKSLMQLGGRHPVEWVVDRLRPQTGFLGINANGNPQRFDFLKSPVFADTVDGYVGPLAGALAGMRWAQTLGTAGTPGSVSHIMTAAADTPFLPHDLVSRLCAVIEDAGDVAMASSNGRIHPVFALWPVSAAEELEHFLVAEDKRKILEFANRSPLHEVVFDCDSHDHFFNINRREDLRSAEKMASELNL